MAQAISKKETTQTAVDWLVDKLMQGEFINNPDELIQQAKQMEKEQIIKAHGLKYYDLNEQTVTGEQYYSKTYNK